MRTWNWILTAALATSMSAVAQQAADSQPAAQPSASDATQAAQPTQPQDATAAATQAAPAQAQASQAAPAPVAIPAPAVVAAPTTMDQVVNLFILREKGLIKMLANRTPVVETYLQNLTADPQLGPVPSEDHYFLGRMDMGETADRSDYLKQQEKSMQSRLLGGFQ